MSPAQGRQGPPHHRVELPQPDQDSKVETRTLQQGYHLHVANQIGEGAYGLVFTGDCKRTHKKIAVKKIKLEHEREGFPIAALREMKVLSSLCHENIVNLREIVRSEVHKHNNFRGSVYMVFDYAEHDLAGLITTHKYNFTEAQIKCIMKQLLKGLAYVHGNGVLHRDLKAANILVDKEGIVKLADFGLARTTFDQHHNQPSGNLSPRVITLWYRPPELLLGCSQYGPEVDVWSVGCIFAELLVGSPIFPGKDEPDQLDRIFRIMGTPTRHTWPGVEDLRSWHMVKNRHPPSGQGLKNWLCERATRNGMCPPHPAAMDLMENLLRMDPTQRLSASQAFKHPWFWSVDPPPCAPKDLPVSGSHHEYTVKKRAREQEDTHAREQQDKRARVHANTQAEVQAAGYNNTSLSRQQGHSTWSSGAAGQMGPPANRPPYQNSSYGLAGYGGHPHSHMPPPTQPTQPGRGHPMPPPGAPPAANSQQAIYRSSTQATSWGGRR